MYVNYLYQIGIFDTIMQKKNKKKQTKTKKKLKKNTHNVHDFLISRHKISPRRIDKPLKSLSHWVDHKFSILPAQMKPCNIR